MNELNIKDFFDLDPAEPSLRGLLRPWRLQSVARSPEIRVDLKEAGDLYEVRAEIPGVHKEDIDVRIDGNVVTISAQIKQDREDKDGDRVLRSERQYGYASRSFALANALDETRSEAKYQNGILALRLPKKSAPTQKKLAIS